VVTLLAAGLVGAPDQLKPLLAGLAAQQDCTVAAVLDTSNAAPATAAFAQVPAVADFDRLLATGIDFVVLLGPLSTRLAQVQAAAEQGVHCLLGSPMAADLASGRAMVAAAEAAGIELGVMVPSQEEPVYDLLRRWLASDWLGGPTSMLVHGHLPGLPATSGLLPLLQFTRWWLQRDVRHATTLPACPDAALLELAGAVQVALVAPGSATAPVLSLQGTGGSLQLDASGLRLCGRLVRKDALLSQPVAGQVQTYAWSELAAARAVASTSLLATARFARTLDHRDDFPCLGAEALVDLEVLDRLQHHAAAAPRGPR